MKKSKKLIITIIIMLLLSVGCEKSNINKVSHKESNKVNQKTYNIYDK